MQEVNKHFLFLCLSQKGYSRIYKDAFIWQRDDWLPCLWENMSTVLYISNSILCEYANLCCLLFWLLPWLPQLWASIVITCLHIFTAFYRVICKQFMLNQCLMLTIECKFAIFVYFQNQCIIMEVTDLFLNLCCISTCHPLSLLGKSSVLMGIWF